MEMTIPNQEHCDQLFFEEFNLHCIELFDRWCSERNVISLAYLMHCWPITSPSVRTICRLASTLKDLLRFHDECVSSQDRQTIECAISLAQELGETGESIVIQEPKGTLALEP